MSEGSTKTPWKYLELPFNEAHIIGDNGRDIALLYGNDGADDPTELPGHANAELIVTAINSLHAHRACAEALREMVDTIRPAEKSPDQKRIDLLALSKAMHKSVAALKLLEESDK